jgi:hypothetical protein
LTGETVEQLFLISVGYSAGNGKSTLSEMFEAVFPIYTKKLDRETFSEGFAKKHKQFSGLKAPIRFVYIEEPDKKAMDVNLVKDFVNGTKIGGNEVLYKTTEDIHLQCKLQFNTNKAPKFETDEGMKRRGVLQELNNCFLEKKYYDKRKNQKGVYLKDKKLMKEFSENDKLRLAFFHIISSYSMKYYEEGLEIDDEYKTNFDNLCDDNDKMRLFIEKYYHQTNMSTDKIYKDDILNLYRYESKLKFTPWQYVLNEIRRLGLTFDAQVRVNGSEKGCVLGLRLKEEMPQDLFENEEQPKKIKKVNPLDNNVDSDSDSDSEDEETDYEDEDRIAAEKIDKFMKTI